MADLQRARRLMAQGDKAGAREIVLEAIRTDANDVEAWKLAVLLANTDEARQRAQERLRQAAAFQRQRDPGFSLKGQPTPVPPESAYTPEAASVQQQSGPDPYTPETLPVEPRYDNAPRRDVVRLAAEQTRVARPTPPLNTIQPAQTQEQVYHQPQQVVVTVRQEKDYLGWAVLSLILYYFGFGIIGLIANVVLLGNARQDRNRGIETRNVGCLRAVLYFQLFVFAVVCLGAAIFILAPAVGLSILAVLGLSQ